MASLCVAYLLWLVGGFLGLHHLYLGRDLQAFLWWCIPGGYFGVGWFRDLWRLPEYVRDANSDPAYEREIKQKIKESESPPWKTARWMGMMLVGNVFGGLPSMAIPNKDDLGMDLKLLGDLLNPLGCAIGIWIVGNIGRWEGSLKHPLAGCYLALPLQLYGINAGSISTLLGAYCFRRKWRKHKREQPLWKRLLILSLCGSVYLSLWASFLYYNAEVVHNGDKIKLRDAVGNFIKSPAVQEFSRNLGVLWNNMLTNGFWSTWSKLVDSLDPLGEKNALKVLGLEKGASQEEIRARYRELTKQWHPDKVKQEEKAAAQEKFVEIQQAYERLSDIKSRRARANKKSDKEGTDQQTEERKTEL